MRIKGRLKKKKKGTPRRSGRVKFSAARKLNLFFFHDDKRSIHMRMASTRVSAHINIYPRIHRSACGHPLDSWHARARWSAAYFSAPLPPVSRVNFTTGLQRRKKKEVFYYYFFFSSSRYTRGRINLYSRPQPRRNFVLRKFAAHLWEIICSSSKIVYVAPFRGSRRVAICPSLSRINAFSAKSFYLGSLASVTVARSPS